MHYCLQGLWTYSVVLLILPCCMLLNKRHQRVVVLAACHCYQASVPKVVPEAKLPKAQAPGAATTAAAAAGAAPGRQGAAAAAGPSPGAQYEAVIKARPEFASLGKLFKSCAPVR